MPQKLYSLVLLLLVFTSCSSRKVKVLDLSARKIITGQKLTQPYHIIELKLAAKKNFKEIHTAQLIYNSDTLDTQISIISANTSAYDTIVLKSRTVQFEKDSKSLFLMYSRGDQIKLKQLPKANWIESKQIPL